jgi:uncharacterized membrane protein YbjE (DUF340 family)
MMRYSIAPIILLSSGMIIGYQFRITFARDLVSYLLYIMLFLIGLEIGSERVRIGKDDLLLPLVTVVGTLAAASLISPLIGLPLKVTLSVAAGFGWYTLAGPLVTSLLGAYAGALAFLSNLLRELISLIFHRTISKIGCNALIACGGAASMDTFLPFVVDACGPESGVRSFISGLILTLITPLAISFLSSLG